MEKQSEVMKYEIGGVAYEQRPILLVQIVQLSRLLKRIDTAGLKEEADLDLDTLERVILGAVELLPEFCAIVLCEEGADPREKNLEELAEKLLLLDQETLAGVVEDFFALSKGSPLFTKLAAAAPAGIEEIFSMSQSFTGQSPGSPGETPRSTT